jgi:hypothetical protein
MISIFLRNFLIHTNTLDRNFSTFCMCISSYSERRHKKTIDSIFSMFDKKITPYIAINLIHKMWKTLCIMCRKPLVKYLFTVSHMLSTEKLT